MQAAPSEVKVFVDAIRQQHGIAVAAILLLRLVFAQI
jgi:hypothetical protein